ncbi:MAG: hypothetical protein KatS3mg038_1554 [Candidatus Kapaibacterium sp.]|nr:MAG: hypothetical protein KatS3mg038_1554 [Candidatus Kapabacteria bacterium]
MRFETNTTHNALPRLNERMRQNVRRGLRDTALECETIAKQYAPFRYGFLRDSIQAEEESELSWIVAPHTDYAIFMEYRHRTHCATAVHAACGDGRYRRAFPSAHAAGGGGCCVAEIEFVERWLYSTLAGDPLAGAGWHL